MSRNSEYKFVDINSDELVSQLISGYEELTGNSVHPASPERIFIQWVANIVLQQQVITNYIGNQNLPSRATGENLNALGEYIYGISRPQAKAAYCRVAFYISEAQETAILVPAGTRVTDNNTSLYWETTEDRYFNIGETRIDVQVRCLTSGTIGNGVALGQINKVVDIYDYCTGCSNVSVSDGGADIATDEEYYTLMRASLDRYSCAGSRGAYEYYAKQVSTNIADVKAADVSEGRVGIFVLMNDGTIASEEIKLAVANVCFQSDIRPMTDFIYVDDPEVITYDIDFTYYISNTSTKSATEIEADVSKAVENYKSWQAGKLGRDITPDKLREFLYMAGVKRIELRSPNYTVLNLHETSSIPQVAFVNSINIVNGGYENE